MTAISDGAAPADPAVIGRSLGTGTRVFLILSIGLLPLAIIALFAALQTSRVADSEMQSRLRIAASESARALSSELVGDLSALRIALSALDADPRDAPSCARVQGVFADQLARGAAFAITDRAGQLLCGSRRLGAAMPVNDDASGGIRAAIAPDGLIFALTGPSGGPQAVMRIPRASLANLARPAGFMPPFASQLRRRTDVLTLDAMADIGPLDRTEAIAIPLGIDGLLFEMSVRSAPVTSALVVAMLLPLLMWAAAAGIGWFVVDRLLIRPLRDLRARVAAFRPGEPIDPGEPARAAAQEIRELGETFRAISLTVVKHEAGLAEGLIRQTKLTREVHHRVKNNLQVISSLINFHSRGARSAEASAAYASIQRRVDALAVVHRNHFAELEENRGLQLRPVIGDLAANLRATLPEGRTLAIALDIDPYLGNQDMAIALSFLLTELIELAMTLQHDAAVRLSLKPSDIADKALLRISSPALVDSDALQALLADRYGRVIDGLSRQLRAKIHHDMLVGAFEIPVMVSGRD